MRFKDRMEKIGMSISKDGWAWNITKRDGEGYFLTLLEKDEDDLSHVTLALSEEQLNELVKILTICE